MQWIPVTEKLPNPGEQVAIRRNNGTWDRRECNPIYFDGLPAWYLPEGPLWTEDVTHWLSLSESLINLRGNKDVIF